MPLTEVLGTSNMTMSVCERKARSELTVVFYCT